MTDASPSSPDHETQRRRRKRIIALACFVMIPVFISMPVSMALRSDDERASDEDASVSQPAPETALPILRSRADAAMREQRWTDAAEVLEEIVERAPDDANAWQSLGLAWHQLESFEQAIEAHAKAASFPHTAAIGSYNLACAHARLGDIDAALEALDQAYACGFADRNTLLSDADLDEVRNDPRFVEPPEVHWESIELTDGSTLRYALVLPRDFDPEHTYPILLAFTGNDQSERMAHHGLRTFWGAQAAMRGWIVINPISQGHMFFYGEAYTAIGELMDHIDERFSLEGDRFHLAGYSNGGASSFRIAGAFPERVQSITTFPGYPLPGEDTDRAEQLGHVTIRMFVGALDRGPSLEHSTAAQQRFEALGFDSKLTVFDDEPHIPFSLQGPALMEHLDTLRERP